MQRLYNNSQLKESSIHKYGWSSMNFPPKSLTPSQSLEVPTILNLVFYLHQTFKKYFIVRMYPKK